MSAPGGRARWLAGAVAGLVMVAAALVVLGGRGRDRRSAGGLADDPDRPPGSAIIEITTSPSGARVLEGGQDRGVTPLVLPVAPGREVVLELVRPGYVTVRRVVTASAGEPVSVRAELAPVEPDDSAGQAPPRSGSTAEK